MFFFFIDYDRFKQYTLDIYALNESVQNYASLVTISIRGAGKEKEKIKEE